MKLAPSSATLSIGSSVPSNRVSDVLFWKSATNTETGAWEPAVALGGLLLYKATVIAATATTASTTSNQIRRFDRSCTAWCSGGMDAGAVSEAGALVRDTGAEFSGIGGLLNINEGGRLPSISSRHIRISCALCQRCAGSRSRHFETSSLIGCGMLESQSEGGTARSCIRFSRLATALSA